METPDEKVIRLDPMSLPYLHQAAAETNALVALIVRIESLRGEMDRAPEWKVGTTWMVDRELVLASLINQLAHDAPGHPLLPANLVAAAPTGPVHVEPVRGEIVRFTPEQGNAL